MTEELEQLEQLMKNLKLRRMLGVYDEQLRAAEKADISYSEFVADLLRAQWNDRQESALEWRIRRANLPERWSLETFPYPRQPGVNRKQIRAFAELDFVAKHENLVLVGKTGVGKTGLACGLLLKAFQNGYRCQFVRAQDLFDDMYASLADRSTRQLLNRLTRLDILLIDDLGYLNLKPEQSNTFFKLMEERYNRHSTIITTNLVYDEWHIVAQLPGKQIHGGCAAEPRAALLPHRDHRWPVVARAAGLRRTLGREPHRPGRVRATGAHRLPADTRNGGYDPPPGPPTGGPTACPRSTPARRRKRLSAGGGAPHGAVG